jgi:phage terminase small subunit
MSKAKKSSTYKSALNPKQTAFCEEYIKDLNGTQAAIRAGYSERTAESQASRLLMNAKVKEYIERLKTIRSEKTGYDAAWVLTKLGLLANFNLNKFLTVNKAGLPCYDFSTATDDDWYCISELTIDHINKGSGEEVYEVERVKLKPESKLKALELMGKHVDIQAFRERVEMEVTDKKSVLEAARKRALER